MKVYFCDNHDCFWPVGVASVVIAENAEQAQALLDDQLKARGLKPSSDRPYLLVEVAQTKPHAIIINDGNY